VTVYRDHERKFAQGDCVQMTAPYHEQKLANRELGTVEQIDKNGNLKLKMDSGREVEFNARQHPHLDYGYAVTSHSSQGQTADRVLIHVDSAEAHGDPRHRLTPFRAIDGYPPFEVHAGLYGAEHFAASSEHAFETGTSSKGDGRLARQWRCCG
jgi:hypothetical protein